MLKEGEKNFFDYKFGLSTFLRMGRVKFNFFGNLTFYKLNSLKNLKSYDLFFLLIRVTLNNLFITIIDKKGEVIFTGSCGSKDYKGPARNSIVAIRDLVKRAVNLLKKKGILNIIVLLKSYLDKKVRNVLKSLFYFRVRIIRILVRPLISHNGLRLKKEKRL